MSVGVISRVWLERAPGNGDSLTQAINELLAVTVNVVEELLWGNHVCVKSPVWSKDTGGGREGRGPAHCRPESREHDGRQRGTLNDSLQAP